MTEEGTGETSMTQVLQALLEERRLREKELEQERHRREEEAAKRSEELEQERWRYAEEAARRESEISEDRRRHEEEKERREDGMRRQIEMLKELVEGVQKQGEKSAMRMERDRDVKVTKLTEADDIEAYLTTFERLMKAYEIHQDRWTYKLAPQLVGKAQQAYAAKTPEDASDYAKLKQAIL